MRSRHSRSRTTCPSRISLTLPTFATLPTPGRTRRGHHCTSLQIPEEALGGPRLASLDASETRALVRAGAAKSILVSCCNRPSTGAAIARLELVAEQARDSMTAAKAPDTVRACAADWRHFTNWCAEHGVQALPGPGETVALYLADLAGSLKTATRSGACRWSAWRTRSPGTSPRARAPGCGRVGGHPPHARHRPAGQSAGAR